MENISIATVNLLPGTSVSLTFPRNLTSLQKVSLITYNVSLISGNCVYQGISKKNGKFNSTKDIVPTTLHVTDKYTSLAVEAAAVEVNPV